MNTKKIGAPKKELKIKNLLNLVLPEDKILQINKLYNLEVIKQLEITGKIITKTNFYMNIVLKYLEKNKDLL